ncbi:MAG: hypothetical protein H6891_07785 [Brucellaceae bacterium]|nr:hypothetical protein [Brucellaceae bacterium]
MKRSSDGRGTPYPVIGLLFVIVQFERRADLRDRRHDIAATECGSQDASAQPGRGDNRRPYRALALRARHQSILPMAVVMTSNSTS